MSSYWKSPADGVEAPSDLETGSFVDIFDEDGQAPEATVGGQYYKTGGTETLDVSDAYNKSPPERPKAVPTLTKTSQAKTFNLKGKAPAPPPPLVQEQKGRTLGPQGTVRILQPLDKSEDHYAKDVKNKVKYLKSSEAREKFKVEIGAQMRRRGMVFDTAEIAKQQEAKLREKAMAKYKQALQNLQPFQVRPARPGDPISHARLGKDAQGQNIPTPLDWWDEALIWVCAPGEGDRAAFYSHVCRPGVFHHSSFQAGGGVIGAGEWIVRDGKLLKISGNSGHYRTRMDALYRSVLQMSAAFQPETGSSEGTTVYLFDTKADAWIDYPVLDFIKRPTRGGELKPHPQS